VASHVAKALERTFPLHLLDFGHNNLISDKGNAFLAHVLTLNTTLSVVDLILSGFRELGTSQPATALSDNKTLITLLL
jgi:hypothetical protein